MKAKKTTQATAMSDAGRAVKKQKSAVTTTAQVSVKSKSLAALVDSLYVMRQERYKAQQAVEKQKKEEDKVEAKINKELLLSKDATGIAGKKARAQIVTKEKVVAEDWDSIWKYILKNKAYDLVQRRLSDTAVKERWNDKKLISGINKIQVQELSITKV